MAVTYACIESDTNGVFYLKMVKYVWWAKRYGFKRCYYGL